MKKRVVLVLGALLLSAGMLRAALAHCSPDKSIKEQKSGCCQCCSCRCCK